MCGRAWGQEGPGHTGGQSGERGEDGSRGRLTDSVAETQAARAPSRTGTRIAFKYGSLGPGGAFKNSMFSVSLKALDTHLCRGVGSWATAGLAQQQLSHPGSCLLPRHRATHAVTFPVPTKHGPPMETEPREGQGHEAAGVTVSLMDGAPEGQDG